MSEPCTKSWCYTYIHCLSCRIHIVDLMDGSVLEKHDDVTTEYFGPDYARRLICKKCIYTSGLRALVKA